MVDEEENDLFLNSFWEMRGKSYARII